MKILVIHNRWLERGGEDEVVSSEVAMLRNFGHTVIVYEKSNQEIERLPFFKKALFCVKDSLWSESTYQQVKAIIRKERPDVAHIHNVFIAMSPSLYDALSEEQVPIVQTLHSYRLFCPKGVLFRDAKVCEECISHGLRRAVIYRCWRGSLFATLLFLRILKVYSSRKIFQEKIDAYIVLSEFSKNKFVAAGLSPDRIFVKPNFTSIMFFSRKRDKGNFALFVGRLVDYKGINTLLSVYEKLAGYNLKIIGDGPLFNLLRRKVQNCKNIHLLGRVSHQEALVYLKKSSFLIFPSECYENMPRTIIESFACGVPVIASNIGAVPELVQDHYTGILFKPGDSEDLCKKVIYLAGNRNLLDFLGLNARKVYEDRYTPVKNHNLLLDIYRRAIANAGNREKHRCTVCC